MAFKTVPEVLLNRVSLTPNNTAFSYPAGSGWKTVSWKEFGDQVKQIAMGLRALGVKAEQRVAILSGTRYEWVAADRSANLEAWTSPMVREVITRKGIRLVGYRDLK